MANSTKSLIFFGNEHLATGVSTSTPILKALIKNGYAVVAVVINTSEVTSRNNREVEVRELAKSNKIPVLTPNKLTDITAQLKSYNADVGILAAYGKMVPEDIINIFPSGIVNIHPSLLPKHRGPTPLESVILDGSSETGVSLMQLVKAMDAGPVYAQETVSLTGLETKQELADNLSNIGAKLLATNLPSILDKTLKPTPQTDTEATYDQLITKLDGAIDWNLRADTIERQIRAYSGWPGARSDILGKDSLIIQAEIIDKTGVPGEVLGLDKQLVVCCGEQAINILSLKPAGKQEMSGPAFLSGYGKHLKS